MSRPFTKLALTSSCGKSPFSNNVLLNGIGMYRNSVTRNIHPVTTPKASGLEL